MIVNPDDLCCQELVELVTDYLDDALPPPVRARFEMHLSYCLWCRDYLDQVRSTARLAGGLAGGLTGGLTDAALPAGAKEALLQAFRSWKREQGDAP